MAAVLVALYDRHALAARVRTELVGDGFPTDRVRLTSLEEPGTAGTIFADSEAEQLKAYFQTLFDAEDQEHYADRLTAHVGRGAATLTVHPRGDPEIARATQILERYRPLEIGRQHLEDTALEHAAAASARPYVNLTRVLTLNVAD